MDNYINKAEAVRMVNVLILKQKKENCFDSEYDALVHAKGMLWQMPSVSVIRCAKCERYDIDSGYCQFWHGIRHPEHYCGEGEKRNE